MHILIAHGRSLYESGKKASSCSPCIRGASFS